jgi:NTE family protein
MPHAQFQIRTLPLITTDDDILAEYRVRTTDFGLDLGRELGNYGEIRVGAGRTIGSARVRVGDPLLPPSEFDTNNFFSEFRYDTLDNVNFPRRGASFQLGWRGERGAGGDAEDADLLVFDQLYAHSWGRHTAILWTSGGTRLDNDPDVLRSYFALGGFLNMSGITPESLVGPHYAIARGIYYRQVGRPGQGFLNVPVYVGASLETGNVWSSRHDISLDSSRTNGSLFIGLDTLLGPVYFATGFDDNGGSAYYLFLGRTF